AGGCTIGNSLVETSLFSYQGWVSLIAIILGTWGAAWFLLVRPQRAAASNRPAPVLTPAA
ncbi:MAG: YeeE/YedE thiosulfate transporter family protein, partial [Brachybacterium tyrofermentans]